ncbi:MAG: flagellar motor switch protein FliN [Gammaproteobacteria bacterium]|nr:flagellar motor switch protein FliN [Gammaproteobacteria bacterium]
MTEQAQTDPAADDSAGGDWDSAMAEQRQAGSSAPGNQVGQAQPVEMPELDGTSPASARTGATSDRNLDVILDIPVTVSMEIGRTRLPIRSLLQLNQGSIVELDQLAGEPMDVLVNGTLIAHGEVVVVNERFGIRLTDVVSPAERVRKLK